MPGHFPWFAWVCHWSSFVFHCVCVTGFLFVLLFALRHLFNSIPLGDHCQLLFFSGFALVSRWFPWSLAGNVSCFLCVCCIAEAGSGARDGVIRLISVRRCRGGVIPRPRRHVHPFSVVKPPVCYIAEAGSGARDGIMRMISVRCFAGPVCQAFALIFIGFH